MNTHLQYKAAAMDLGDASFDAFDAEEGAEASRELSLALWEKSLQDAVDRTTLSLQRLQAAKAAETREHAGELRFSGVAVDDNNKLLKNRIDWLARQLQKTQSAQQDTETLVAELRESVQKSSQLTASNKRTISQLRSQVNGLTERINRGFVAGPSGLPLEPKQLEIIIETFRPQLEQVAIAAAKQECAKSMRKILATTVESSNKQLAAALGEVAAIKKAVQMLSTTTFKNRDDHTQKFNELNALIERIAEQTKTEARDAATSYREEVQSMFDQIAKKTNELANTVSSMRNDGFENTLENIRERLSGMEESVHAHRAQLRDVLTAHAQVIDTHEQQLSALSAEHNSKCNELQHSLQNSSEASKREMQILSQALQDQKQTLSDTVGIVERKMEQSVYQCTQLCAEQQKRVSALTDAQRKLKEKLKHLDTLTVQMQHTHALMDKAVAAVAVQRNTSPRAHRVAMSETSVISQFDEPEAHATESRRIDQLEQMMLKYTVRIDEMFEMTQQIARESAATVPPSDQRSMLQLDSISGTSNSNSNSTSPTDFTKRAAELVSDTSQMSEGSFELSTLEPDTNDRSLLRTKRAAHRTRFQAVAEKEFVAEQIAK